MHLYKQSQTNIKIEKKKNQRNDQMKDQQPKINEKIEENALFVLTNDF